MLTIPPSTKLWFAAAVDLRLGFDGLSALVRSQLDADPLSGHLFVFTNRSANRVKVALEQVRQQLWDLYQDLKAYRAQPDASPKAALEARFDLLVSQKSNYPTSIGAALKEMRVHKADLLRVLDRPEVPLHNNGTESIIRGYVKTRKISGSTRSAAGRRCRDTFASLKKTCRKLGVSFWAYVQDRVRGVGTIPRLADLIRQRAAEVRGIVPDAAVPAWQQQGGCGQSFIPKGFEIPCGVGVRAQEWPRPRSRSY